MTRGRWIVYSDEEMAWLEANRALPIADYHQAFRNAFGRPDVDAGHLHALRKRKGWKTGRTGQFAPGQAPPNKGQRCPEGTGGRHPNARRTQFRKGCARGGIAAKVYKPIGTERVSVSGYLERKINDDMPLQKRWRAVHLIEWERVNGPMPKGFCLKCLDDNKLNVDLANWELIPRAVLGRMNQATRYGRPAFDGAAPEVKQAVLTMAKIEHRAGELRQPKAAKA